VLNKNHREKTALESFKEKAAPEYREKIAKAKTISSRKNPLDQK